MLWRYCCWGYKTNKVVVYFSFYVDVGANICHVITLLLHFMVFAVQDSLHS